MKLSTFLFLFLLATISIIGYKSATNIKVSHSSAALSNILATQKVTRLKHDIEQTMQTFLASIDSITDAVSAHQAVPVIQKTVHDLDHDLDRMRSIPRSDQLQIKHYMMDFVKYMKKPMERLRILPEAIKVIDPSIRQLDSILQYYKPL